MLHVRSGRNPYEVAVLTAFAMSGLSGLISPSRVSGTSIAQLPIAWQYIWYAGLLAMSGTALTGVLLLTVHGLLVERAGLLGLAVMLTGYSVALVALYGIRLIPTGLLMVALVVANIARIRQIRRDIEQVKATLQGG